VRLSRSTASLDHRFSCAFAWVLSRAHLEALNCPLGAERVGLLRAEQSPAGKGDADTARRVIPADQSGADENVEVLVNRVRASQSDAIARFPW
jgi:hypothetical protein